LELPVRLAALTQDLTHQMSHDLLCESGVAPGGSGGGVAW
jgi:hypothetical protein